MKMVRIISALAIAIVMIVSVYGANVDKSTIASMDIEEVFGWPTAKELFVGKNIELIHSFPLLRMVTVRSGTPLVIESFTVLSEFNFGKGEQKWAVTLWYRNPYAKSGFTNWKLRTHPIQDYGVVHSPPNYVIWNKKPSLEDLAKFFEKVGADESPKDCKLVKLDIFQSSFRSLFGRGLPIQQKYDEILTEVHEK